MSVAGPQKVSSPKRYEADRRSHTEVWRNSADPLRVFVSGFPSYTRVEDIKYVFSTYGHINVKISKNFAVITFPDANSTAHVLANSKKFFVYGSFLTIKPYTGQPLQEKSKPQFVRSKEKNAVIEPQKINLSGNFYQQLEHILNAVRLTQEEVAKISTLYHDLENALQSQWPGCRAVPFGSITTGLGIKSSDADCYIELPDPFRRTDTNFVTRAKKVLQQYPDKFTEVYSIPNAHTPIVKFFHIPTETNCDVSFKTLLGSRNSQLIAFLLHADPRLIPVAVAIKYWAKAHGISGSGRLTNYALTMLFIFYLQQLSILPAVEWLQRDCKEFIVDDWNTGFCNNHAMLPKTDDNSPLVDLFGGFFVYYSKFNFEEHVVCPLTGSPIKKLSFTDMDTLPEVMARYKRNVLNNLVHSIRVTTSICIQDPLELSHNVGSSIANKLALEINAYFKFAAEAYQKEKSTSTDFPNFLKTILLEKPIIPTKAPSVIKAVIHSRHMEKIVNNDWKVVVRGVITTLLQDICLTKLEKLVEAVEPEAKIEVERYSFTLTKAVWKRKKLEKLFSQIKGTFLEKQIYISKEIIYTEKETHMLKLHLEVRFSQDNRSVTIQIKHIEGDKADYVEFGKFFTIMFKGWFFVLIQPYLKPQNDKNKIKSDTVAGELANCSENILDIENADVNNVENDLSESTQNKCRISNGPD